MSTILDALRKVEENQRTRSADARAQLLSFPSRPSAAASRQHRAPWIIGAGLALVGFAAGVGLMFWGPRSHGPEDSQMASATGGDVPSEKSAKPAMPAPAEPTAQPSRPAVAQPLAQARSQVPTEPPSQPASILAQGEAQAVPQVSRPQSLTPPTESAPLGASPTPQLAMPTLPSPFPPPSAPAERPAVSLPPASGAALPTARSAQAAPVPQLLDSREARRAARREARQARQAAHGDGTQATHGDHTSVTDWRELAAAARAARGQGQPLAELQQKLQPEAPVQTVQPETPPARIATAKPKSSPSTAVAVTMPPNTSLSFLQWSPDRDRRLAFIKINGGPLTLAHEGDTVEGYTVVEIRHDAVELSAKGRNFTLQVEE